MSHHRYNTRPLQGCDFTLPDDGVAADYCAALLKTLGASTSLSEGRSVYSAAVDAAVDWAQSGLIPLTGLPDRSPLQGPGIIASCARGTLNAMRLLVGKPLLAALNGATLLSERAAILQFSRNGACSPNGFCRLLEAKNGWLVLNLARDYDWELVHAWLETTVPLDKDDAWSTIAELVVVRDVEPLVARGRLMGLPVAPSPSPGALQPPWYIMHQKGLDLPLPRKPEDAPLVVDLSSLWAGPLSSHLLRRAGSRVIKIESSGRPDGARQGSPMFFDLLNGGKESVALDFNSDLGKRQLESLLSKADIVIEGSRPRALRQLGIDAEALVATTPGLVWISITGYGRTDPEANWVAFGDDAAAAAGVAVATCDQPLFCGDALADPLTGLHAAVAALAFWRAGQGALLDLSLCNTTAYCLNFAPNIPRGEVSGTSQQWQLVIEGKSFPVSYPVIREPTCAAATLGSHTQQIVQEFDLPC